MKQQSSASFCCCERFGSYATDTAEDRLERPAVFCVWEEDFAGAAGFRAVIPAFEQRKMALAEGRGREIAMRSPWAVRAAKAVSRRDSSRPRGVFAGVAGAMSAAASVGEASGTGSMAMG
jgi:hypothetical protein